MLFETAPGRRRLFRPVISAIRRGKTESRYQRSKELPENWLRGLLDWYRTWNRDYAKDRIKNDPLLGLRGSGEHIWADEHADDYIRRLREGWE